MRIKTPSGYMHITPFQVIILGYVTTILTGSLLLMMPAATGENISPSFVDALFTATSATCVTGLVVHDTATYWSAFGQTVILFLIQIGGMGVITIAISLALISKKKIGLMQRSTMQQSISAPRVSGIVRMTAFIFKTTFFMETAGALLLSFVFIPKLGTGRGIWYSVFHSISAFCNSGFDLFGIDAPYSSMTEFTGQPLVNITMILLIVIGGISFFTWDDVKTNKFHFKKYHMQTKVILTVTAILIFFPAVYFYFFEFNYMPSPDRFWASLFQSVTPRTAGFNTADLTRISEVGQMLLIILMITGGSPSSTAGGIKTTTVAVLCGSALSAFRKKKHTSFFGRRIPDNAVNNASTVLLMYAVLVISGGMIISAIEGLPLLSCLFETSSAIGTVGLSLGITDSLGMLSKIILIITMFVGRVGGLTLIFAILPAIRASESNYPQEKIIIG